MWEGLVIRMLPSLAANLFVGINNNRIQSQITERQLELEHLRQDLQQGFQREQFEKQKQLQLEIAAKQRETQLEIAAKQRELTLQLPEVNNLFQNWPLKIIPSHIIRPHQTGNIRPLTVIIAPPEINFDKFGNTNQSLPKMENSLAEGLRQFLSKNYSLNSQIRPIELLDGAWDSNRYHGGSSIRVLFEMLKSEPVLILQSEVEGNYLNFRLAYWGYGQETYSYESIISQFPYRKIVYESAKARALKWREKRDTLAKQLSRSLEEVDKRYGGDNALNLKILEEEEKLQEFGIDTKDLPIHDSYKLNNQDFDPLCQFLINTHCIVAGWVADAHYLINHDVPPLMPQLLPELTKNGVEAQVIESVLSGYQEVYRAIEKERSAWIPELALDLANSLMHLSDKSWAKEQVNYSVQCWLKLRGVTLQNGNDILDAMYALLAREDKEYLEKVRGCLIGLEDEKAINKLTGLLKVIELKSLADNVSQPKHEEKAETKKSNKAENIQISSQNTPTTSVCSDVYNETQNEKHEQQRSIVNVSLANTLSEHSDSVNSIAISPDGQTIISGSNDKSIKIWDISTGKQIYTFCGHTARVNSVAISPDGQTIISSSLDRTIKIWDLNTRREIRTLLARYGMPINSVKISSDGQNIITGSTDSNIYIWDINTGKIIRTLLGHSGIINSVVSLNSQKIASCSRDSSIKIWDISTGKEICTINTLLQNVNYTTINSNEEIINKNTNERLTNFLTSAGTVARKVTGIVYASPILSITSANSIAITPDEHIIVYGGFNKNIYVWQQFNTSKKIIFELPGHSGEVNSVALSPDGQTIISGSADKTIKVWELSGKQICTLTEHSGAVNSVAISPDGQTIVSGSADKTIKVWRMQSTVSSAD